MQQTNERSDDRKINDNDDVEPTHDVFVIEEIEGRPKPRWRKVGMAFTDADGDTVLMLPANDGNAMREVLFVAINRNLRPIAPMKDARRYPTHELFTGYWKGRKKIGAAWPNKDGSFSLVVDEGMKEAPKIRYQMRAVRTRAS